MTEELKNQKCVPCEGGIEPMTEDLAKVHLARLSSGWELVDGKKIIRDFSFKNFKEAVEFINKIAAIAEEQGHHPNLRLHNYKYVEVELYTHKISGLHLNDFILAAQIEAITN